METPTTRNDTQTAYLRVGIEHRKYGKKTKQKTKKGELIETEIEFLFPPPREEENLR